MRRLGCVLLISGLAVEVAAPGCLANDQICHALAAPPHTHSEIPTGTLVAKSEAGFGSNNTPHLISLNVGDNLNSWQDRCVVLVNGKQL